MQTLGKYEIRGTIGRGAMGTVLEAWDPVIGRRVAIKTVPLHDAADAGMQEELQRCRREAQAAGRLSHPNIVAVHDYGETGEIAYIVMEYVDGQSLKAALDGDQRMPHATVLRLMQDLLDGLEYSHEAGVIHRDIKPANLILTRAGRAKIADFGIARIESSSMTQAGTVMGTPAYMSPEQFRGEPVDLRTDIYSAGVLLYQMLTGERPFEGSLSSIMHKALTVEPPAPSSLSATPAALDPVVARAMAKRPEDRYASAAELLAAIRQAMAAPRAVDPDATVVAPPAAAPVVATPAPSGRRLALPVAGGVLAVAAAVAAFVLLRSPQSEQAAPAQPTASKPALATQASPPPVPEPAPADPAALRGRVAAALAALPCTAVTGELAPSGEATLRGFTGPDGLPGLRAALTAAGATLRDDGGVAEADPSYCAPLAVVAPILPAPGEAGTGPELTEASGGTRLGDGQFIRPVVRLPDGAGNLLVDYYAHDGSVEHIFPRPDDRDHPFAPGTTVTLGQPGSGHPTFQVGTPYGRDMIVAVAASQPLFATARRRSGETGAEYARALRAAIEQARAHGARVSAAVMHLDTAAR